MEQDWDMAWSTQKDWHEVHAKAEVWLWGTCQDLAGLWHGGACQGRDVTWGSCQSCAP